MKNNNNEMGSGEGRRGLEQFMIHIMQPNLQNMKV